MAVSANHRLGSTAEILLKTHQASNKMLPYHDSRFRGYGYNKVVHALLLSKQKYKFKVLSNPFLIHDGIKEETSGQSKAEQELNTKESFIKISNFTDFYKNSTTNYGSMEFLS